MKKPEAGMIQPFLTRISWTLEDSQGSRDGEEHFSQHLPSLITGLNPPTLLEHIN